MTDQTEPQPESPRPEGADGAGPAAPGDPEQPDAIPAQTDDPRDVPSEPADADRPNPKVEPAEATDPSSTDEPLLRSAFDETAPADDESADGPGEADLATVPDYELLAAEDPRTPGQLLAALHGAETSRDEYLEALQRKQAEFENFRKRMQANGQAQRIAGHADVVARMLDVLDDFDRTLDSIADDVDDGVLKGVTLVRDKLMGALREVGLERVDDHGAPFDPNRHEAVQQVPGDGGEPVVAEVLRPGYVLGPKVLRAAMVAVAQ